MTKTIKVQYSSRCTNSRSYWGSSHYTNYPKIQMEGKWLEALGFNVGDRLQVEYDENGIHITHAPEPEPMMVAEPAAEYGGKKRRGRKSKDSV